MTELRPTILIVEDEPDIRRFLRASLDVEGYRVVESGTGRRGSSTIHRYRWWSSTGRR